MKDYLGYSRYSAFLGSRFGSQALAAILYQTSLGDFVYSTDASGNAILDNQGSLGSANDGLPYSGRGIELGATNDVDFPIHHTLGAELYNGTISGSSTFTDLTGGAWNWQPSVTTATLNVNSATTFSDEHILLQFDITINTNPNNSTINEYYDGTQWVLLDTPYAIVNGINQIEVKGRSGATYIQLQVYSAVGLDIDINSTTAKQITNPNSYLTYYDMTLGEFVTLDMSVVA